MKTTMWGSGGAEAYTQGIGGVPATINADGTSEDIDISSVGALMVSVKVGNPSGTTPTLNFYLDVKDAIGNWLQVCALTQLTGPAYTYAAVGPGTPNSYVLTGTARLRWDIAGAGASFPGVAVSLAGR